jgi:hypothetical protein
MATCCPFRLLMDRRLGILAWGGTHLSCMQCSMKKRKNIVVGKNINGEKKKSTLLGLQSMHIRTLIEVVVCVEMITSSLSFKYYPMLFGVRPWNN